MISYMEFPARIFLNIFHCLQVMEFQKQSDHLRTSGIYINKTSTDDRHKILHTILTLHKILKLAE